ncbi:hypothetical protein Phum_PHUM146180 [Pediculus humanus corporis]|uniref:Uncharacterized protein n=1 Tax=Pediculus humanus subsp. corporis TaxID=121224 RepID=E0VEW9_PEDHC|nr:uncharacterized protein Phum_PHUM146180 [Pediculus humanus corporis]EEB11943.1 hypothetical protein Phum_PHUM146180 [Pediculus humanus corporis]
MGLFSKKTTGNACAVRTYPVRLSNNGPTATTIPIINKHVRTPTLERLPLRTAGCIPRPKTIDNVCTCYKTIVKPQVHNQIISVPSVQRVIQTSATPVIEKIHYEATPVDSPINAVPVGASPGAATAVAVANALKGRLTTVTPAPAAVTATLPTVTAVRTLPTITTIPLSAISSGLIKPGSIVNVSPFITNVEGKCGPQLCGCRPPCQQQCAPLVPLMLDNCGPNPSPLPPINAPPLQTPVVEKAPVSLPACIPPPKTIANTCHCLKTVVKPQVVQQMITVPSIQRYIQTTHTPVVENIQYQGVPINCPPYTPDAPPAAPPAAAAAAPAAAALPPPLNSLLLSLLSKRLGLSALSALSGLTPPAPALPPCAPALPPCAPALPPCAPALPPCAPALPPCPPALPPCAPAAPALSPCLPNIPVDRSIHQICTYPTALNTSNFKYPIEFNKNQHLEATVVSRQGRELWNLNGLNLWDLDGLDLWNLDGLDLWDLDGLDGLLALWNLDLWEFNSLDLWGSNSLERLNLWDLDGLLTLWNLDRLELNVLDLWNLNGLLTLWNLDLWEFNRLNLWDLDGLLALWNLDRLELNVLDLWNLNGLLTLWNLNGLLTLWNLNGLELALWNLNSLDVLGVLAGFFRVLFSSDLGENVSGVGFFVAVGWASFVVDVFNDWLVGGFDVTLDGWNGDDLFVDTWSHDGLVASARVRDGFWGWDGVWKTDSWFNLDWSLDVGGGDWDLSVWSWSAVAQSDWVFALDNDVSGEDSVRFGGLDISRKSVGSVNGRNTVVVSNNDRAGVAGLKFKNLKVVLRVFPY